MSDPVPYDPELFLLQRTRSAVTADVHVAQFTVNSGYTEDALGTLLLEAESATAQIAFWGDIPATPPLRAGDAVLASYDGVQVFKGKVDEVTLTFSTDPAEARPRGYTQRAVLSAAMVGDYFESLNRVSQLAAPVQGAYARLLLMVEELDDNALGFPSDQVGNQPVGVLTGINTASGQWASPLEVIRSASVMTTQPVRVLAPNHFAFVGTDEPVLPDGIDAEDGPSMYSEALYKTTSGPRSVALIGTAADIEG